MQRIFSIIKENLGKRVLLLSLIGLLSLSGLLIFSNQPALAERSLSSQEKIDRAYTMSEATGLREEDRQEAYEEATEAVSKDPKQGLEEIYEEDLQTYRQENPDQGGVVESAKNLVDKVTGKE
jgi:hypothetical protein